MKNIFRKNLPKPDLQGILDIDQIVAILFFIIIFIILTIVP